MTSSLWFSLFLQLNLKFEIEVLCKNLSLDINDLKPGSLLKDKDKLKSLEEQLSAPKKEAKPPEEMLPIVPTGAFHAPLNAVSYKFGDVSIDGRVVCPRGNARSTTGLCFPS